MTGVMSQQECDQLSACHRDWYRDCISHPQGKKMMLALVKKSFDDQFGNEDHHLISWLAYNYLSLLGSAAKEVDDANKNM